MSEIKQDNEIKSLLQEINLRLRILDLRLMKQATATRGVGYPAEWDNLLVDCYTEINNLNKKERL